MKNRISIVIGLLIIISFSGCVRHKKMYYFGNYSRTLYAHEKNKNDDSFLRHQQELESVIEKSKSQNMPVPPGIYAELGYMQLKKNNIEQAVELFQAESSLYPESKLLMDKLLAQVKPKPASSSHLLDSTTTTVLTSKEKGE